MNPGAIYSKSGKGVQEASGKTSLLKRGDRAVLSAIDGRTTLAEVAKKVGKDFDAGFQQLITQLDKDGFVREVTTGSAASSTQPRPTIATVKSAPAAKAAPAPSNGGGGDDLDFTTIMPAVKPASAPPPKPASAPPAAKPASPPPAAKPAIDLAAQQRAKEQEAALYKARQEAEARAQAEREKLRQEAEAKARAEAEAKLRAEAEAKIKAEAEAKAEAKARAEAEKAKAEAARAQAEAEAKARAAREAAMKLAAEAKAKAEAEAQAKIEAERKAREEAERKAREEAEQARREAEELRQRLEAERKAREEAERKAREEEEARRRKEEEERQRKAREEEEARQRKARAEQEAQMRKAREEAAERARKAEEERARKALEETKTSVPALPELEPAAAAPSAQASGGSLDALMADLDSFSQREEQDRQAREAAERQLRDEKQRQAREEAERRAREQAAEQERARQRAAEEARRREEDERRAQEEAERRVREAEEQRRRETEERQRKSREAAAAPAVAAADDDIKVTDDDLGMDEVRRDEAAVAKETRKQQREREREQRQREKEAKERARAAAERQAAMAYSKPRRPVKWGRPVAITLFAALVLAVGALHVVPLPMEQYEDAASEALGRPVKIGSGKLSLITGVSLNLERVTIGDTVKIASVQAYPRIGSLIDEKKAFRRIELQGMTIDQRAIGATLGARMQGQNFNVTRVLVKQLKLEGPVPLPTFEADAVLGQDGAVRLITLRGPDSLNVKLTPAGSQVEIDATAASVSVPFVPELSLSSFAMKGIATRQGMNITGWGGALYDGGLSGTANVRWTNNWQVEGVVTARAVNAAVFAPALLSDGKAEGTGRFSMSGADPAKLYQSARLEGTFLVNKGVLGSFDLSRIIQTGGRQHTGRTQFTEMSGQALYDRGALALRNVTISAGALGAGASADIAPSGAVSGRIIADMKVAGQSQRASVGIAGTVKEPQVRN